MKYSDRIKGYYDIYYIAKKFEFDETILTEAAKKTFCKS